MSTPLPIDTQPRPDLALTDFPFLERLRVRWSEVDSQRIVFNGNYLSYFDVAFSGFWRALAMPYEATMAPLQLDMVMRSCALDFQGSARLEDQLQVGLKIHRTGRSSITFDGGVFRDAQLLVAARISCVFVDRTSHRPAPVPPELLNAMQALEAGEPPTTLASGSWAQLGEWAGRVRRAVFVDEQGIAPELEWDEHDAQALHVVVRNRLGEPVATGRCVDGAALAHPGVAKIGRMAVSHPLRGAGLGAQVLGALVKEARRQGYRTALLHAQVSACGFYEQAGFVREGEVFMEVNVPHVRMTIDLSN
jgi:YbgC/YbaW family acyl-CoA thioester hydrolase